VFEAVDRQVRYSVSEEKSKDKKHQRKIGGETIRIHQIQNYKLIIRKFK
jgi:hypothetical protein